MSFRLRIPVPPREKSRRQQSLNPEDVPVPELSGTKHKSLRSFFSTGGYNGRISERESSSWNVYGPERKRNADIESLRPIREFKIEDDNLSETDDININNDANVNTYCNRLLSVEQIDEISGSCRICDWYDAGDSFACFLMESKEGKKIGRQNIINLLSEWKKTVRKETKTNEKK